MSKMIFLDIDNTLMNHTKAERNASIKFGSQYKSEIPNYDETTFYKRWNSVAEKHFETFLTNSISFQEQRRRRVHDIFMDDSIKPEEADKIFEKYLVLYEESWEIFSDVLPFLKANKQWQFAVISDGAQEQQERKLKKTGISSYFNFVLTSEMAGRSKPDPILFTKACELAESDPSETFYIGDNIEKDVMGACNAGLNDIWINRRGFQTNYNVNSILNLSQFSPNNLLQPSRNSQARLVGGA